jgi:hypothetical protein
MVPNFPAKREALSGIERRARNDGARRDVWAFMNHHRRNAREAKAMLGESGTLRRVAAFATVYQGYVSVDDWVVESFDSEGSGEPYITVFSGPKAKERAIEYATEKYPGFELRSSDPPPRK